MDVHEYTVEIKALGELSRTGWRAARPTLGEEEKRHGAHTHLYTHTHAHTRTQWETTDVGTSPTESRGRRLPTSSKDYLFVKDIMLLLYYLIV